MDEARAAYLRQAIVAITAAITAQMVAEVAHSTDSGWWARLLAPQLPRLRQLLLDRLSEADPEALERTLSAAAWACEQILAQAPGVPLPRYRVDWEDGRLVLVPLEGVAA